MRWMCCLAALGILPSCTEQGLADGSAQDDSASALDSGLPEDSDTGAQDEVEWAAWFSVGGSWTLQDGAPVGLEVVLGAWPEDPKGAPLCTSTRAASALRDVNSPDPSIYHWWLVDLGPDDAACAFADEVPRRLILGLGQLHPEMVPALDRFDLDTAVGSLYGAFAAFPDTSNLDGSVPYAYGFAGTSSDRAGAGDAVGQAPLPDGTYAVTPVYLLAIPGAAPP